MRKAVAIAFLLALPAGTLAQDAAITSGPLEAMAHREVARLFERAATAHVELSAKLQQGNTSDSQKRNAQDPATPAPKRDGNRHPVLKKP